MDRMSIRTLTRSRGLLKPPPIKQLVRVPPTRALSSAPRIASASFWKSLIPKPLRRENRAVRDPNAPKTSWLSKEWNPATFYIIIFLLIGSMAIQMISLRKNFDAFMRRSDVRIGLLREVVERIQNGEEVDVEKVLGSGDPDKEAAWEEVLNEIEKDNAARNQKKQDRSKSTEPSSTAAKAVSVPIPRSGPTHAQEPAKGRTSDFF